MKYIKSFEGLNLSGTYLSRREENTKKALEEIRKMIVEIADKLKIDLPVKEWSEDFIKIKKELSKEVDRNTDISFLLFSHLSFHEQKTFLVNAMLKYASNASSEKNSPQKIVIGHLDFKKVPNVERDPVENETYQVIFPDNIKKLIQDSPDANKLDTYVYIKCETGKWNRIHFPGRVDRLYRFANLISGVDEAPQLFKGGKHGKNAFDLLNGIPTSVRGIGLGQAIYSEFIKFYDNEILKQNNKVLCFASILLDICTNKYTKVVGEYEYTQFYGQFCTLTTSSGFGTLS